jgi:ABC-type molybdenum transport system ATPase subunit/photorepair protein PhrA
LTGNFQENKETQYRRIKVKLVVKLMAEIESITVIEQDNHLSPILSWRNVNVVSITPVEAIKQIAHKVYNQNAENNGHVLLKNVSGQVTGGLWAIIGASGSGKFTLFQR